MGKIESIIIIFADMLPISANINGWQSFPTYFYEKIILETTGAIRK